MKINILGQIYDYKEVHSTKDKGLDNDPMLGGYCDGYGKIIRIRNNYNKEDPKNVSDLDSYIMSVKRHEIMHAFFEECGLDKYGHDEVIVEWIARQFPKILKVFRETGAI